VENVNPTLHNMVGMIILVKINVSFQNHTHVIVVGVVLITLETVHYYALVLGLAVHGYITEPFY
jgi:hypothetical protein